VRVLALVPWVVPNPRLGWPFRLSAGDLISRGHWAQWRTVALFPCPLASPHVATQLGLSPTSGFLVMTRIPSPAFCQDTGSTSVGPSANVVPSMTNVNRTHVKETFLLTDILLAPILPRSGPTRASSLAGGPVEGKEILCQREITAAAADAGFSAAGVARGECLYRANA